jgi:predicted XRE-type DNA-binding protein
VKGDNDLMIENLEMLIRKKIQQTLQSELRLVTQTVISKILRMSQPKVSRLASCKEVNMSLAKLIVILLDLGVDVVIDTRKEREQIVAFAKK